MCLSVFLLIRYFSNFIGKNVVTIIVTAKVTNLSQW